MLVGLSLFLVVGYTTAAVYNNLGSRQDLPTLALSSAEKLLANDELQCLPRLLCEQLAGRKPGQLRALNVDTQSLFTLLQYLGLDTGGSPMLGMGQALLTGLSNKGDSYACYRKYPRCPRDQTRLLHYLNNHRGGFFRGFSHPHYSRTESRIVNANKINDDYNSVYSQPNTNFLYDRPLTFSGSNRFGDQQSGPSDSGFIFPSRRPKSFNFKAAAPTDRLPSRFQFPEYDSVGNFGFGNWQNFNFFPEQ